MRDIRNQQAIFTSLRNAIVTTPGASRDVTFQDQTTRRVLQETSLDVPALGFRGAGGDTVSVTVFPGSQIDNREDTTDSIHFSYGGREYESVECQSESGIGYDLRVQLDGYWRPSEQVYAPDDKLS